MKLYTKEELIKKLNETCLFNQGEVKKITSAVGIYSMGCAVIACEVLGISLTGNDVDVMFIDHS